MNDEIVVGDLPDCSTKQMEEALNGKLFSVTKATLEYQMSICLFVHPSVGLKPKPL